MDTSNKDTVLITQPPDAGDTYDTDEEGVGSGLGICGQCKTKTKVIQLATGRVRCLDCFKWTIDCNFCAKRIYRQSGYDQTKVE